MERVKRENPEGRRSQQGRAANELADLKARLRKFEAGGGGKPPDKPPPDKTASAALGAVVGVDGEGAGVDALAKSPLHLPENVSCVGRWAASRRRAPTATRMRKRSTQRKAERERANLQRQVRRLQGALNVSDDEAVTDEENAEKCLSPPHVSSNLPLNYHELSPEVFPKFLGTVCYNLSHNLETPTGRTCIAAAVAPVLPPFLRPGLAQHGETVKRSISPKKSVSPKRSVSSNRLRCEILENEQQHYPGNSVLFSFCRNP